MNWSKEYYKSLLGDMGLGFTKVTKFITFSTMLTSAKSLGPRNP